MKQPFSTESLENTVRTIYDHKEKTMGQCQEKACTENPDSSRAYPSGTRFTTYMCAQYHQGTSGCFLQALGKVEGGETQW